MALNFKKIGLYSSIGILSAIVLIVAVFASGIQLPTNNPTNNNINNNNNNYPSAYPSDPLTTNQPTNNQHSNTGTLLVSIKDKPVNLANLYVTISGLYAHNADSESWIELNLGLDEGQEGVEFDLLALQTTSLDLSQQDVPAGNYTKIRLEVTKAMATYEEDLESNVTLKVPPGHIDVLIKFELEASEQVHVLIDMQPDSVAISQSNNLKPTMKATIVQDTTTTPPSTASTTDNQEPTPTTTPTLESSPTPTTSTSPTESISPTPTLEPTPTTEPTTTPTVRPEQT